MNGSTTHFDVGLVEAELIGDRVGDGALEALAVGRVVVLEVGREGRAVGGDGERAGRERLEVLGRAVLGGDGGGGRRILGLVVGATAGNGEGG